MKEIMNDWTYSLPATTEDVEIIFDLTKELVEKYEDASSVDIPKVLEWLRKKIVKKIEEYRVIYYKDCKVGYYCVREENGEIELDDFYILEEYRNQGIGSSVLTYLTNKHKAMFLYVFTKNTGAISLYKRYGFRIREKVGSTRAIMEYREE